MLFLIIFIAVPIIEIAAFIKIGDIIGLWPTIACIILTAIVGTFVLRQQGLSVLQKAQTSLQNNQVPLDSVIHGAFLLVAGALLLTPGFFTDAVGFILLVPPARSMIAHFLWKRMKDRVHIYGAGAAGQGQRPPGGPDRGPIIEGEAVEVEPEAETGPDKTNTIPPGRGDPSSPWNK